MGVMQEQIERLDALYEQVPPLPCTACGLCCTAPHLSFVEFARLLRGMMDVLGMEGLRELIAQPLRPSLRVDGNLACLLQDRGSRRCLAHEDRPFSCRLEGFPVMDELVGRLPALCPVILPEMVESSFGVDEIEAWQMAIEEIDAPLNPCPEDPYFIDALNLPSWFAVCLDREITQKPFLALRAMLADEHDLAVLGQDYVDMTGIAGKLNRIDEFFRLNEEQRALDAYITMRVVREGYPGTGLYYDRAAAAYLEFLEDVLDQLGMPLAMKDSK